MELKMASAYLNEILGIKEPLLFYNAEVASYVPLTSFSTPPFTLARNDSDDNQQWHPVSRKLLIFGKVVGMTIVHINGQRFYGPPVNYNGPSPPRGSEVFVGAVPRYCDELELVPIFSSVGRIYQMRLMMDFSGSNRGYCFVQYYTVEEATFAIQNLHMFPIRPNVSLGVFRSVDNCRLRLTGIRVGIKWQQIRDTISRLSKGLVRVTMTRRKRSKDNMAILEFETHRDAALVRKVLLPSFSIEDCVIEVNWEIPFRIRHQKRMRSSN